MSTVAEISTAFRSSGSGTRVGSPQASPGLLVFSLSLQLQYVNRRGFDLVRRLGWVVPQAGSIVRSTHMLELRDQISAALNDRLDAKIREPFEVYRASSVDGTRLLLRGIGCPDPADGQYSRIIIVLEEVSPEEDIDQGHAVRKEPERQSACAGFGAHAS